MKRFLITSALLLVLVIMWSLFFRGCANKNEKQSQAPSNGQIEASSGHIYPTYPDPKLTPGDTFGVTAEEICQSGYTAKVRAVSSSTKKEVFAEYNLPYPPPKGAYEVDHFIPLELGGSNDIKNLWPEPADPQPGFHQKDVAENYLHRQICSGVVSLKQAQEWIRKDWLGVYEEYELKHTFQK